MCSPYRGLLGEPFDVFKCFSGVLAASWHFEQLHILSVVGKNKLL